MNKEIVITGCGFATAAGCNASLLFSKNIREDYFQKHPFIEAKVAFLGDEDLTSGIPLRISRKLDRFALLTLQAFHQTLNGDVLDHELMKEFGILLGNSTGGWSFVEPQMDDIYQGNYDTLSPYVATAWFPTSPQGEISIQYKISGYSKTFAADALSAGYALEHGCYLINEGYLPGAFVGGVESPLSSLVYNACKQRETLSTSGNYLPYHENSDGYLLGEGAAIVSLEAYEEVLKRKKTALAKIKGLGLGNSLDEAILKCLENAAVNPSEIDCVFLEAKGIQEQDGAELSTLDKIFSSNHKLYLTTTKTVYGSLLAADFAVQLVIATLSLMYQKIPTGLYSKNMHTKSKCGRWIFDEPLETSFNNALVYARNPGGSSICTLLAKI